MDKQKAKEPFVYDKAKCHYDGEFPQGLPHEQGFVHTGMFLGWVIDSEMYEKLKKRIDRRYRDWKRKESPNLWKRIFG
jgi:hypothetical protein